MHLKGIGTFPRGATDHKFSISVCELTQAESDFSKGDK